MKTVCLYFQVHQPFRYRRYRFFDIGNDHYYYDDYSNEAILHKVSEKCYLPANKLILSLIKKHGGKFRVAFSLSGIALEQFSLYAPEVIKSFQELAKTGCVEFLSETYSHSMVSMVDPELFAKQVKMHDDLIEKYFGQRPTVFRNTELIYSDEIGEQVAAMGFKAMLTEGARHILGWKSPNYIYCGAAAPQLKLLLRNYKLSDDVAFRFSNKGWNEYPLTADKFANWIAKINQHEEIVNLFMDYETLGEHQWKESGIFDFMTKLPAAIIAKKGISFRTPSEAANKHNPISVVSVPHPISWADEERDLSAWLGNEMQKEAFDKLYSLKDQVALCKDPDILKDWNYLQISDHFYYMCTKFFSDGEVHKYFNPYENPYEAFINYMNVLSDFHIRLDAKVTIDPVAIELERLRSLIDEKDKKIEELEVKSAKKRTHKKVEKAG
ncbi:MAG: glycoside hydrolase family 57 protein [Bacteroidota bacterium]|nr:glycoside hydrolase family 57 protein [Bacteroidota bacterium]MDP4204378.1 glycoside hydrolase family 57 protein [Bacteroidota bacterium]